MSEHKNPYGNEDIGEDLNIPVIFMVGVIYTLILIVAIVLLAAYHFQRTEDEVNRKALASDRAAAAELLAVQSDNLGSYEWLDSEALMIKVPIERAMDLAAERLAGGSLEFVELAPAEPALQEEPAVAEEAGALSTEDSAAQEDASAGGADGA